MPTLPEWVEMGFVYDKSAVDVRQLRKLRFKVGFSSFCGLFTTLILSSAQGFGSVDNELKTHIPYRIGISRAYHGVSGDRVVTESGAKISTLSLGLPITGSAGIGVELQVGHNAAISCY